MNLAGKVGRAVLCAPRWLCLNLATRAVLKIQHKLLPQNLLQPDRCGYHRPNPVKRQLFSGAEVWFKYTSLCQLSCTCRVGLAARRAKSVDWASGLLEKFVRIAGQRSR